MPINLGISIRNMGPQSEPEIISEIAVAADRAGFHSLWVPDHIAIPPDEAEGSGGRYVDLLATLSWLAGQTKRIKLGTGVLILPYREPLATAKWVASIQELSGHRLLLGVGIGWMQAEFSVLGKSLGNRVRDSHEVLAFLSECFASDEVSRNGQRFIFKPRPPKPPIYVGGAAPHAITRALRYGDGWMPMGKLDRIRPLIAEYRERSERAGRPNPEVVTFCDIHRKDQEQILEDIHAYEQAGVTTLVLSQPYDNADPWLQSIEKFTGLLTRS